MTHESKMPLFPRRGVRAIVLSALVVTVLVAGLANASPVLPKPASAGEVVPISLTASDFKTVPFAEAKTAVPLYSRDLFATSKETVDGFLAVVDATKGDVRASSPFARAEWIARVPDPKKQANVVLSWSSVWAQLTAFAVQGDKVVRVATMDENEEDVAGLCSGINSEGERTAVLVTKGGWVKYYLLDIDHEDDGKVEVEMRRIQTKFLPLQADEIPSACAIHGLAPHHALIATELGTIYEVDFASPTNPQPTPIYRAAEEVPAIAPFYVAGNDNTAFAIVAEKDEALTILSRSRNAGAWQKVKSINLKPTVEIEDVSGLSIVSNGLGFERGVLTVTSETGSYFFALDRILQEANVIQRGASVLGDLPRSMEQEPACDADDECNDNGFCVRNGESKQCRCYEGFSGKSCKTATQCPCSPRNGICPDKKQPTVCQCKPGFSGPTCSTVAVAPALTLNASSRFENKGVANDNDDPEVYVHPTNKDDSVILGTTKSKDGDGGLHVWALDGTELWFAGVPKKSGVNSVDILMGVPVHGADGKLTGQKVDLALGGIRGKVNAIGIWRIDPVAISANRRTLKSNPNATQAELAPVLVPLTDHLRVFDEETEFEVYGSCAFAYKPKDAPSTNTLLVTTKDGDVHQFSVTLARTEKEPKASLTFARKWTVGLGTQLENCVGDGDVGTVYIGEEAIGVWRYDLGQFATTEAIPSVPKPAVDPATGRFEIPIGRRQGSDLRQPVLVDGTHLANPNGKLHRDVEGLGVYVDHAKGGRRTLVVSSQGANEFSFYDVSRSTAFPFRGLASIQAGPKGDAVTKTDSLAVSSVPMGAFGRGTLVVHDDATTAGSDLSRVQKAATFKVVSWTDIEKRLRL